MATRPANSLLAALTLATAWVATVHLTPSAHAEEASIQLVSLQVHDETAFPKDEWSYSPVGSGTLATLLVKIPGEHKIISIDNKQSKIARFVDDKGTDLTKHLDASKNRFQSNPVGSFIRTNRAGTQAVVTVRGMRAPAKGASSVQVLGGLVFNVAKGTEEIKLDGIALKEGEIPAERFAMKIRKVEAKEGFNKEQVKRVSFEMKGDIAGFKDAKFVDADEKPTKARSLGSSWGDGWRHMTIDFPADTETANLRLTMHKDMKQVEVPVAIKQGIGF